MGGTNNETGRLRTALVHRPGAELRRITPRTAGLLESGRVPWVARAQREHDEFTDVLRDRGVEVHYMADLLADVLGGRRAREEAVGAALTASELGAELEPAVRRHLDSLTPEELARALIAGLTAHELPDGRGLRYDLLEPRDFVLEPAANLAHSRDCGVVIGEHVVLPGPRRREAGISGPVYRHLPMFAGLNVPEPQHTARLDCADILLMAPGVVALGVGERTSPAAAESLARRLLGSGAARAVLAVPLGGRARRLDTTCTIVGPGIVLMAPAQAFTLTALTITVRAGSLSVSRRWPFLEAAAAAIGLDRLVLIETAADPPADGSGQWEDGGNVLALGNQVLICDERNALTNARLRAAGFDVVEVPGSELGGGPRSLCSAVMRDVEERPDETAQAAADVGDLALVAGPAS